MGISDRYIEYKDKYDQPRIGFNINSPVMMLIIINFSIFLFVQFLSFGRATGDTSIVPFMTEKMMGFLVPPSWGALATKPWSVITYSIFHFDFLNIVSNMLWLWGFGTLLQTVAGDRPVFPLYIYGAIAGALVFTTVAGLLNYNLLPMHGASAAVMAVAVAVTTLAPNFRLFPQLGKGIPIWVLTAIYIFIDLIGMSRSGGQPYYAAHLAGALMGFVFMLAYKRGNDWGAWMHNFYRWFMGLFNPNKQKKGASIKEKVFYQTGNRSPYSKTSNITQQRVDEILDKINQKGYDQLSKEEREILKRASEEE